MDIISVIPTTHNGPSATIISALDNKGKRTDFTYSHTYELIHNPNAFYAWLPWNGGNLTEAIKFIENLPN